MMRNTLNSLPRLSRTPAPNDHNRARSPSPAPTAFATPPAAPMLIPTIRLTTATPCANGTPSIPSATSSIAPKASPRKRLVPKKSKLSLLGVGSSKSSKNKSDFSDVTRRIGGPETASASRSFDIFVDAADDPDIGEIVYVKKKKSRAALDGMQWGALGDVTNVKETVPAKEKEVKEKTASGTLKIKLDGMEKWWSTRRGRNDSKGKGDEDEKSKSRAKSPEPEPRAKAVQFQPASSDPRQRAQSLDMSMLINGTPSTINVNELQNNDPQSNSNGRPAPPRSNSTPLTNTPFGFATDSASVPTPPGPAQTAPIQAPVVDEKPYTGSIALRAMRSVRSMARIGGWGSISMKNASHSEKEVKKEKKSKKKKEKGKEGKGTVGSSGSSFEAGEFSPGKSSVMDIKAGNLGPAPSGTMRTMSSHMTTSSDGSGSGSQRLSVGPPVLQHHRRMSSVSYASGSSVEPMSSGSSMVSAGRTSKSSSGSSVRWGETTKGETVKEMRVHDVKGKEKTRSKSKEKEKKASKRADEEHRRLPVSGLFPDAVNAGVHPETDQKKQAARPVITIKDASPEKFDALLVDVEGVDNAQPDISSSSTPEKKARPRPMSENLLGRRPRAIVGEENDDGVMTILDAATTDLANLIGRLDLQATPDATPRRKTPRCARPFDSNPEDDAKDNGSPVRKDATVRARAESPSKKVKDMRWNVATQGSLRPYAQSRGKATSSSATSAFSTSPPPIPIPALPSSPVSTRVGQQIAAWNVLGMPLASTEGTQAWSKPDLTQKATTARQTHKRTLSPSASVFEAMPVFQPLRPAKSKANIADLERASKSIEATTGTPPTSGGDVASSSMTFGTQPSRISQFSLGCSSQDSVHLESPTRKTTHGHGHHEGLSSPLRISKSSSAENGRMPIPAEGRRMGGTLGSMGSNRAMEKDTEAPDSDIPDELQTILSGTYDESGSVEETLTYRDLSFASNSAMQSPPDTSLRALESSLPEPGAKSEPECNPIFRAHLIDDDDNEADIDDYSSEDDTKKSFDFTGELRRMSTLGGSDRRSFVEQLENAFMTPVELDICGLGEQLGLSQDFLKPPNVNASLPPDHEMRQEISLDDEGICTKLADMSMKIEAYRSGSELGTSQSSNSSQESSVDEFQRKCHSSLARLRSAASIGSRPSDGQLNRNFKFGGKPRRDFEPMDVDDHEKSMNLSDIIPPSSHPSRSPSMNSMLENDTSMLKSIFGKAAEMPSPIPRQRLDSDSSSKRHTRQFVSHTRNSSELSFAGFTSFGDVRRGFEFGPDRPAFYPPPESQSSSFNISHNRDSMFSIPSISSYGVVINSGSVDPFDYGSRDRPLSEDMSMSISMSTSVDDTFSFMHREPRRQRVESDASSFYFNSSSQGIAPRRHQRDSYVSAMSPAPPVSLYNRSFGAHKRNDSNTSVNSLANSYGMHGTNGGLVALSRHRHDQSVDSVMSDFSASGLVRPGLGDKMLESMHDYGMPLAAISASPPQSVASAGLAHRSSFDSIMDDDHISSTGDSLFDATGRGSSVSSESVFGNDDRGPPMQIANLLPPNHFRPLSVYSVASPPSMKGEDDTMISMLGGGHVRRRSIESNIEASPCMRAEKRMHDAYPGRSHLGLRRCEDDHYNAEASPNKARIVEKVATPGSARKFGGDRMTLAQRGLLERRSLEDGCLSAEGEDLSASSLTRPVFRRPGAAARSRLPVYVPASSGADTPPLSASDGSSISSDSQSSIDVARLNVILTNASHPVNSTARGRTRARARGHGHTHSRRVSQIQAARSSVYETIQEELPGLSNSPSPPRAAASGHKRGHSSSSVHPIYAPEPDVEPDVEIVQWDDEEPGLVLRKYYALHDEAQETLTESKRLWGDTPFSVFAVQSFDPPRHPAAMRALLEHSQKTYGPLAFELRSSRRRSRTISRPSPYTRSRKNSQCSPQSRSTAEVNIPTINFGPLDLQPLRNIPVNTNADLNLLSPPPAINPLKAFSPLTVDFREQPQQIHATKENASMLLSVPDGRPRVRSNTRKGAPGWSQRSTGKSAVENKENAAQGTLLSPNQSLRIVRPRPRGRPAPTPRQALRM